MCMLPSSELINKSAADRLQTPLKVWPDPENWDSVPNARSVSVPWTLTLSRMVPPRSVFPELSIAGNMHIKPVHDLYAVPGNTYIL